MKRLLTMPILLGVGAGALVLGGVAAAMTGADHASLPPAAVSHMNSNAVEHAAVTRWNEALDRVKKDELDDPALADILERDVIAPFKKIRQELRATKSIPERLGPLFERLDDYTAARAAAWDMMDAALRQPDREKQGPLLDTYRRQEAEVAKRLAAYEAEVRALTP